MTGYHTIRRIAVLGAVAFTVALGTVTAAQAADYGGDSLTQLRQGCLNLGHQVSPDGYLTIPSTQVSYGSTGICVALAQTLLDDKSTVCVGSPPLSVDGQDGKLTNAAVECFQRDAGLQVDGQVGPQTWTGLWDLD
jgi:peptidoglycan hydrolase-like protein with peptidoglycan-binding domain